MESRRDKSPKQKQLKSGFAWRVGIMRLLTQNVLNYPEVLESSRRSSECLLFFIISIDNDLITEKQLVPRKGVTEQLKGAKSNAVGAAAEQYPGLGN